MQYRETDAPLRQDYYFLSYCTEHQTPKLTEDQHCKGPNDVSPFALIPFGMVSQFVIDPMHTAFGAFQRRLMGLAGKFKNEGEFDDLAKTKVDRRLKIFERCVPNEFHRKMSYGNFCTIALFFFQIIPAGQLNHWMLLQHGMLLLGGFELSEINSATTNVYPAIIQFQETGARWPKRLIFPDYCLTNVFPNNFCMLKNDSYAVISNISRCNGEVKVSGHTFEIVENAFESPYVSSQFKIAIVSKTSPRHIEIDIEDICGKLYAFPMDTVSGFDPSNIGQRWFVSPIHHTLQ